ncbi:hypothetical protein N9Z46_07090, partial [Akkermansiaceae bacterium]|nr:hypothetical protein [Akkermansiaceae bacterium]
MKTAVIGIISTLVTMVFGQFEATSPNPGLKNRQYQQELADAYERIDPTKDGWVSEAQSSEYQIVLENFLDSLLHQRETKHITPNFSSAQLLKPQTNIVFENAGLIVRRIFKDSVRIPYSAITSHTEPEFKAKVKMISVTSKTSDSLDSAANHGLAIADVNGDGLEDLYLCQQGG